MLVQDDKYKERVVKAFAQLEEEYNIKTEQANNDTELIKNLCSELNTIRNENSELRRQLMEKGV